LALGPIHFGRRIEQALSAGHLLAGTAELREAISPVASRFLNRSFWMFICIAMHARQSNPVTALDSVCVFRTAAAATPHV